MRSLFLIALAFSVSTSALAESNEEAAAKPTATEVYRGELKEQIVDLKSKIMDLGTKRSAGGDTCRTARGTYEDAQREIERLDVEIAGIPSVDEGVDQLILSGRHKVRAAIKAERELSVTAQTVAEKSAKAGGEEFTTIDRQIAKLASLREALKDELKLLKPKPVSTGTVMGIGGVLGARHDHIYLNRTGLGQRISADQLAAKPPAIEWPEAFEDCPAP